MSHPADHAQAPPVRDSRPISDEWFAQCHAEWTAAHPPVPGLRWALTFDLQGHVCSRRLEVQPGWEDAYAPARPVSPSSVRQPETITELGGPDRLGALAFSGWFAALPQPVRDSGTPWGDLPEEFREPLRQAAIVVWQHAENAGFHEALLRTLPAGQLGAAGALEDLGDFIGAVSKLQRGVAVMPVPDILMEIRSRVAQLRRDAAEGAKRARKAS